MKKSLFVILCLISFTVCTNAQSVPSNCFGVYLNENFNNYIILSQSNDTCLLEANTGSFKCFGCPVAELRGQMVATDSTGAKATLDFHPNSHTILVAGTTYRRVTLADSVYTYADSLLFYAGLAYQLSGENGKNAYRKIPLLRSALPYLKMSIKLNKIKMNPYIDLGVVYFQLDLFDSAKIVWDKANLGYDILRGKPYYKALAIHYLNEGLAVGKTNVESAIVSFRKGIDADSTYSDLWYNLGGALFTIKKYKEAKHAWIKTLELDPANENARRGLGAIPEK